MRIDHGSATIFTTVVLSSLVSMGCNDAESFDEPSYVGGDGCVGCHAEAAAAWAGSHHDLAMQVPTAETVLGDFSGVTLDYYGRTSTFLTRNGTYFVNTDGPDGQPHDYPVAYTFGVFPLQQYLVEFPDGNLQALGIAWDARPRSEEGQRWYHLYPDEDVTSDHPLHWTGAAQRWNYQCAECHSTNLEKNYDLAGDHYTTTWSDLDVSCEACHGPGSAHVDWARSNAAGEQSADARSPGADSGGAGRTNLGAGAVGLVVDVTDRDDAAWVIPPGERIAVRAPARTAGAEISVCASCHSRRQLIDDVDSRGGSPLNTLRPALLVEGLYHSDGQIQDEVYVYGSFVQSAMYAAGVSCGDCHDPHSARLRAPGNTLCSTCHLAESYDARSHHNHPQGSSGAECVSCHMPEQKYMGVDSRRDHSIRIPRPDLTVTLGTPNACSGCHSDQTTEWASDAVSRWYGTERSPHYGEILARGRQGIPTAGPDLADLAVDPSQPAIVRATALELLRSYAPSAATVVEPALLDPDPLVRFGGVRASESIRPEERVGLVYRMLEDSVKLVRIEAARVLASVPRAMMPQSPLLDSVTHEYVRSQLLNSERPEAHLGVGALHAARGDLPGAQAALETAIEVDSTFIPAFVNLADLLRGQGRDEEGERLLRQAIGSNDQNGVARHALGLSLVRQGRTDEALVELRGATVADPQNPRFAYVYGVALHSEGQVDAAITFLEKSLAAHPYDLTILTALLSFNRDAGDLVEAVRYAEMWVELAPNDPEAARELADLLALRGG